MIVESSIDCVTPPAFDWFLINEMSLRNEMVFTSRQQNTSFRQLFLTPFYVIDFTIYVLTRVAYPLETVAAPANSATSFTFVIRVTPHLHAF
jgi:hypothetical protein